MGYLKAVLRNTGLAAVAGCALLGVAAAHAAEHMAFLVPSATVYPGQVVSNVSLLEKKFYINPPAAKQYVLSLEQADGKVARRTLLPGKPILVSALGEPSLVTRGVPAPLVFTAGTLVITAMGTPLESGAAGDFIKVRNVDSGIIVSGTVLANGRIQVGMQ
ncbi:flagellar basal body P-ring formation chaperone FlgA [Brucella oryzae]|uniref:Flagella basal body P-ring formation protein FlgA n=1 Tax=Brucella oryzae TaxID=335286 RepID=A0A2S7IWZ1_9HYPH|nr:flagellar basal body P-ring formation chaperone FlgA [Brucella oryzae]MBR7654556.1 flagellar basal body P-ring formation protein FlgA [Brucella oryzae]PQA72525.1 flagella basal body P-ring formation protein FlgA [Brucella oryzae]